jgi:hypothetical protein
MRNIPIATLAALAVVLVLAGCSRPFTVETPEKTVEFTAGGGSYHEKSVDIPDEALEADLEFKEVKINYELSADQEFADVVNNDIEVTVFVSADQTADDTRGSDDEQVFKEVVPTDGSTVTDSAQSDKLEEILNDQQESFVIGATIGDTPLDTGTITLTVNGEITAEANLGL